MDGLYHSNSSKRACILDMWPRRALKEDAAPFLEEKGWRRIGHIFLSRGRNRVIQKPILGFWAVSDVMTMFFLPNYA